MEGDETFDSSLLGHADEVVEERIADDDVIMIKGTKNSSAVCISFYFYEYWNNECLQNSFFFGVLVDYYIYQTML